jgi:hypothetical protein
MLLLLSWLVREEGCPARLSRRLEGRAKGCGPGMRGAAATAAFATALRLCLSDTEGEPSGRRSEAADEKLLVGMLCAQWE